MKQVLVDHLPHITGWSAEMKQSQVIPISATTTVDFVFFKLQNLRERFDQARTKKGNYMDLRAVMDLLVAISARPDLAVDGKPVDVMIYEP